MKHIDRADIVASIRSMLLVLSLLLLLFGDGLSAKADGGCATGQCVGEGITVYGGSSEACGGGGCTSTNTNGCRAPDGSTICEDTSTGECSAWGNFICSLAP